MITSGHDTANPAPSGSNPASLVVVGVDDSPQAQAALVWAAGHAQRTGARVLAVAACRGEGGDRTRVRVYRRRQATSSPSGVPLLAVPE
jgi:hypothetical protein